MRVPPLVARMCVLVGSVTLAGCGLTLDVDPPDVADGSAQGFDGGSLDGGTADGGPVRCAEDVDCADDLFCNGEEACVEGTCVRGAAPCDEAPPCTVSTCQEGSQACVASDVTCPEGQLCDPTTGACAAAPSCAMRSDCPDDGIDCNGTVECEAGRCVPGAPVACAETDAVDCTVPTCSVDGCVELAVDAACPDAIPGDCMVPVCSATGCAEITSDAACDDGAACSVDTCHPPSVGGAAAECRHTPRTDPAVCDDGVACTVDGCAPEAPMHDAVGCVHVPADRLCPTVPESPCGTLVCAGADGLAAYPMLDGCAPDLSSTPCGTGAIHCVPTAEGPMCQSFADGCATDSECSDGSPCNGTEACVAGRCARTSTGCPPVPGSSSWCDLRAATPTCRYRVDPAVTTAP